MKKIALGLRKLTILLKVAFGRKVATSLDGNADFPTPSPTVAEINAISDELEQSYNEAELARQIAKEKTALQNQKEAEFDEVMNKSANYVENTSNGDEAKIISAGFTPKADGVYSDDLLPAPENLSATLSDIETDIDLQWDKVEGAASYDIEMTTEASGIGGWTHVKTSTKSSTTITGLENGRRHYFRVKATNTNGASAPSITASKVR